MSAGRPATDRPVEDATPREALRPVRLALAAISAAMLFAMMGVTVVDVVGRYFLNAPLPGASELTELLLVGVIFTGLPAVCLDDGHVTVDLLTERLAPWTKPIRLLVVRIVTIGALAVIGWRLWIQGTRLASYGEVSVYLRWPVAPVAYFAAALCLVSALLVLALIVLRADEGGRVRRPR
jgi:TRAP-type C4-dicarboxylate transport system permease small subunit